MPGAGFMKHGAEAGSRNRTLLKRYGRFSTPKNMFAQLKYRQSKRGKLLRLKKSRPDLVLAVRRKMEIERKKSLRGEFLIAQLCLGSLVLFIWLLMSKYIEQGALS